MKKRTFRSISLLLVLCLLLPCIALADTWTCPGCGRANDNSFSYCPICGSSKKVKSIKVGDIITFGSYPQTKDEVKKPIEWIVLEVQGSKALIISKYGLDAKPYNKEEAIVTWEECTLRSWLNNGFLKSAFSAKEREAILTTSVDNSNSQHYSGYRTDSGYTTKDKIYLLSYKEANQYFDLTYSNKEARVHPTAYAIKNGAYTESSCKTTDGEVSGWWWLRSPGQYKVHAAAVRANGTLQSYKVRSPYGTVRPVCWIDLTSDLF